MRSYLPLFLGLVLLSTVATAETWQSVESNQPQSEITQNDHSVVREIARKKRKRRKRKSRHKHGSRVCYKKHKHYHRW